MSNLSVEEGQTPFPNYAGKGVCLAKAHLFGTLDSVGGDPVLLKANKEATLRIWPADTHLEKSLAYAVLEFDVTGPAGATLWFRTFATASSAVGNWNDPPEDPHPSHPHVRGWWPKSGIVVTMPGVEFDAKLVGGSGIRQASICEQGACVEHQSGDGFGALTGSGHEHDLDNKGCYGVDLLYRLKLVNTDTTAAGHVYANVVARHVVTYFGAAHVAEPGAIPGDKRHVPQLYEPGYPLTREAVDLLQARAGSKVAVPAGTDREDNFFLRIRVANGGACATPANIVVSREALSGQPVSGGS